MGKPDQTGRRTNDQAAQCAFSTSGSKWISRPPFGKWQRIKKPKGRAQNKHLPMARVPARVLPVHNAAEFSISCDHDIVRAQVAVNVDALIVGQNLCHALRLMKHQRLTRPRPGFDHASGPCIARIQVDDRGVRASPAFLREQLADRGHLGGT